jgi:hypothetical protein
MEGVGGTSPLILLTGVWILFIMLNPFVEEIDGYRDYAIQKQPGGSDESLL